MNPEEVFEAFVAGLITALLTNALFPIILSSTVDNTKSLSLSTRILFLLLPLTILIVVALLVFQSKESLVGGVFGVLFSVFVLETARISEFVVIIAIIVYVAYKVLEARE